MNLFAKTSLVTALAAAVGFMCSASLQAQPDPKYKIHDMSRPVPKAIDSGFPGDQSKTGKAPSDAVVLFDGTNLDAWTADNGSKTKWVIRDGAMECVPGSGYIRTAKSFGDCQLHVEWAAPSKVEGDGQGRGNSGVFLGGGRYEIQVLDSYNNRTYADGQASAIYGQYPPYVNPIHQPGEWNTYDIIYFAPRFEDGKMTTPARISVLFNGVLVQWDRVLSGPTGHHVRPDYQEHDVRQPISLQDHGNPVRFRNIWVRELE